MARLVRNPKLDTRSARVKLPERRAVLASYFVRLRYRVPEGLQGWHMDCPPS